MTNKPAEQKTTGAHLRTTVIIEETCNNEPQREAKEVVEVSDTVTLMTNKNNNNNKKKKKKTIVTKLLSKMMDCSAQEAPMIMMIQDDSPSQSALDQLEIAALRCNSPLLDRKRSDGTVETEKEEDYPLDRVHSHADTVAASTVVVSNKSHPMTRILCNMSTAATLREVNAWRSAACDLLLL